MPSLPPGQILAVGAALAAGLWGGQFLAGRVRADLARSAVIVLALLGASATVVKGALAW